MRRDVTDSEIDGIEGWFTGTDKALFRFFLSARDLGGDVAELGAYLGKSAALIGAYVRPGETFTVIDLFGANPGDDENADENTGQYPGLSQERFEQNYRRIHGELPVVVRAPSSQITASASHGTHRFVHIDASHLYEHVVGDVEAARTLLAPDGVVVFDDYRSEHTPGVAAVVWGEVAGGLHVLVTTSHKLYATWGDPGPWREALDAWLPTSGLEHERQTVAEQEVVRVWPAGTTAISFRIPSRLVPYIVRARMGLATGQHAIGQAFGRLRRQRPARRHLSAQAEPSAKAQPSAKAHPSREAHPSPPAQASPDAQPSPEPSRSV